MTSAMKTAPPSPSKAQLIRDFLRLSGLQRDIDEGRVLDSWPGAGAAVYAALPRDIAFGDSFAAATGALRSAYEPHRHVWQEAYERHVNWEFEEDELKAIVAFLESPAGQHLREATWRMNAYIRTNTEPLVEQITKEAIAFASKGGPGR
jgi:hypothetical protein